MQTRSMQCVCKLKVRVCSNINIMSAVSFIGRSQENISLISNTLKEAVDHKTELRVLLIDGLWHCCYYHGSEAPLKTEYSK